MQQHVQAYFVAFRSSSSATYIKSAQCHLVNLKLRSTISTGTYLQLAGPAGTPQPSQQGVFPAEKRVKAAQNAPSKPKKVSKSQSPL